MVFKVEANPNNNKVYLNIKNIELHSKRSLRKAFYFSGKDITDNARDSILRKPKSGRVYFIYKNGRRVRHQASAPGESPANLTGTLRKSIDFKVKGASILEVGADTPYARRLELGGDTLASRPYLISAINDEERNIEKHFERELQKGLGRL